MVSADDANVATTIDESLLSVDVPVGSTVGVA